jgi:two-component system response regulator RstA
MVNQESIRILLVEDDFKLASLVREFLEVSGMVVSVEPRGDMAAARIRDENPDLVILDLMLPGLDGLSVCRQVRPFYRNPILILTALGDEIDEVVGLEVGADDYMTKPVRPRLLLARIHSLLRHATRAGGGEPGNETESQPLRVGPLELDPGSRRCTLGGLDVELTTTEFDLLLHLVRHAGRIVTREELHTEVRGVEWDGLDRSVDIGIARLRRKLGDDGKHPQIIKSVRGSGYLLAVRP